MRVLKLLCVLFTSVTVMLCGCGKSLKSEAPISAFKTSFTAEYNGTRLKGILTNTGRGVSTVEITAPKTLEGLRVFFKNGEISLERDGIQATADESYLPSKSFPRRLTSVLSAIEAKAFSPAEKKQTYQSDGINLFTDENLLPLKISGEDFEITFTNAEKLE